MRHFCAPFGLGWALGFLTWTVTAYSPGAVTCAYSTPGWATQLRSCPAKVTFVTLRAKAVACCFVRAGCAPVDCGDCAPGFGSAAVAGARPKNAPSARATILCPFMARIPFLVGGFEPVPAPVPRRAAVLSTGKTTPAGAIINPRDGYNGGAAPIPPGGGGPEWQGWRSSP